jgi:WD40 repeat protein
VTIVTIANPERPRRLATVAAARNVVSMVFDPRSRLLAVQDNTAAFTVWSLGDPGHPSRLATLSGHVPIGEGQPLAFAPDGRTVAVAEGGTTVSLWDVNGHRVATIAGRAGVDAVAFSPDGRTLATGGGEEFAQLWDVTDRVRPRALSTLSVPALDSSGGTGGILSFGGDGKTLFAGSSAAAVHVFDVTDRALPVRVTTIDTVPLASGLAVSPDGRSFAADVARLNRVMVWDESPLNGLRADPSRTACSVAGRGLTRDEWARYVPELPYQRTCSG